METIRCNGPLAFLCVVSDDVSCGESGIVGDRNDFTGGCPADKCRSDTAELLSAADL